MVKNFGGQSITISVKTSSLNVLFLSGQFTATPDSLEKFDVPISKEFQNSKLAKFYLKNRQVRYSEPYEIKPQFIQSEERICDYSGNRYFTDPILKTSDLIKMLHPDILKKPEVNIGTLC